MTAAEDIGRALAQLLALPERLASMEARLARIEEAQRPRIVQAPAESPEDLLTVEEAASIAKVEPATVREWIRPATRRTRKVRSPEKRLRACKPPGSSYWRICRADLLAFLRGHAGEGDLESAACRIASPGRGLDNV